MKKNTWNKVAAGLLMVLAAVWGGAIALHYLPEWLEFPAFATAAMLFCAGAVTFIATLVKDLNL